MPIISAITSGGGGSAGGLSLAAVSNIQTMTAGGKVYIKWTDPEDLVVAGSTLMAWGGTLLVRKAGSAPVSRRDGTVVLDSRNRNAYQNTWFCDSGLTNGVTYYYKFFPYSTTSSYTDDTRDEFTATPEAIPVGNVTNMNAVPAGNGKLAITYTDPDATVVTDGVTVATWAKTTVVVKEGSYATDPNDPAAAWTQTVVTRNAHTTSALVAEGLTNGTNYYVSFFPITTDEAVNTDAANRVRGIADRLEITVAPQQSGTLTYNATTTTPATAQSPSWDAGYDSTKMTMDVTPQTNAGDYEATATPLDDYCWADALVVSGMADNTSPKPIPWTINQKTGTVTSDPAPTTGVVIDKDHTSATFSIVKEFDGTILATIDEGDSYFTMTRVNDSTVQVSSKDQATGTGYVKLVCSGGVNYTNPAPVRVKVTCKFTTIYGVTWDGSAATTMNRTDAAAGFTDPVPAIGTGAGSSPFDTLQPWAGMEKVNDSEAGVLVKIPKFYYKLTKNGNALNVQVADGQVEGFHVSPAHMDRGDGKGERDFVYVGRYHCHTSNFKSQTGGMPKANVTRSAARTGIHNLGTTIWQMDFAMRFTIWLLYIVEFANWDSQTKIGYGCGNNSAAQNMGYTDSMTYHTGTTQSNRTTYGLGTQYRWIEGLWDNVYDWMDGCYYNSNGMNIILNPSSFSDNANGTLIGKPTGGYPSALGLSTATGIFPMFYPTTSSGSQTTYIPDVWGFGASNPCLRCGGYYVQGLDFGLFCVLYSAATYQNANIGSRLQKLP